MNEEQFSGETASEIRDAFSGHKSGPIYHTRAVLFESGEHSLIGDHVELTFEEGKQSAKGLRLSTTGIPSDNTSPPRTLGHVIAMAGDFFGDPNHPISTSTDPKAALWNAFKQMCQLSDQADAVEAYIDAEIVGFNASSPPSSYYSSQSFLSSTAKLAIVTKGRYLLLANVNWDHFSPFAFETYLAGHRLAMATAVIARQKANPKGLELAYLIDAFACHYLTDLFSAGHLRTPRKALYDLPNSVALATGLLAKAMHDEDSLLGLKVHNRRGDTWVAYGDKKLLDDEDRDNYARVVEAVQASMDEVWIAYQTSQPSSDIAAGNLVPLSVNDSENHAAMFVANNGTVKARDPLLTPTSHSWTTDWTVAGALAKLKLQG